MRKIKHLVIHCSDSPDALDIGAKEIRQWHLDRGWKDIGYHWVIRRNGEIEPGRSETLPGAHVRGHNRATIAFCWVGRASMSWEQYKSLREALRASMKKYGLGVEAVKGHYEFDDKKTCPNFDMNWLRGELREMQHYEEEESS